MTTKLEELTQRLNDDPELADALLESIREHVAERDALRAEVERLRLDVGRLLVAYGSRGEFDGVDEAIEDAAEMRAENNRLHVALGRILRAAQSNHRAWKRERDLVERYQRDHDEWMWNTDTCDCAICDEARDRKSFRSDMRDGLLTRLSAFIAQLSIDGLDIDDPTTAPVWTGKIHAPDGALLFDLATTRARAVEVTEGDYEPSPALELAASCNYDEDSELMRQLSDLVEAVKQTERELVALDAEMEGRTP